MSSIVKFIFISVCLIYIPSSYAFDSNDLSLPGYLQHDFSLLGSSETKKSIQNHYTIMDINYKIIERKSEKDINKLLTILKGKYNLNDKVNAAAEMFENRPYGASYLEGEGDWGRAGKRGVLHVQQSPVYRTDQFVCNTLVQTILAAINSSSLSEFKDNIIANEYGSSGGTSIHYYNRNNFISGDFNPVNQRRDFILDDTSLFPHLTTSADIDRNNWFYFQEKNDVIGNNVTIIDSGDKNTNKKNGEAMHQRFVSDYPTRNHDFPVEKVSIDYIPKQLLAVYDDHRKSDKVNRQLIDSLPTPSIVEVVRSSKNWNVNGKNIKEIIGTGINVSHLGVIYKKNFKENDLIYNKITCSYSDKNEKVCQVTPILCERNKGCTEVMYTAATSAYPNGYYYYKSNMSGSFECSKEPPKSGEKYTLCNRVMSMPLGDYFSSFQYGDYVYMKNNSILGMNIEKIIEHE